MSGVRRKGHGKLYWAIGGVFLFVALDILLVVVAYMHGHPEVQGTTGPIPTYSSPVAPAKTPAPTPSESSSE